MDDIRQRLDRERQNLLDLTLRNPLLNYRLYRAQGVQITDELPQQIYDLLVVRNKQMYFEPAPEEDGVAAARVVTPVPDSAETDDVPERHRDNKLQTTHGEEELNKRLRTTYHNWRTYIEEQGVNVLFLALGMLNWYEDSSSTQRRQAPLILVPLEIHRKDVLTNFYVKFSEDEIVDNLPLRFKLQEFGVALPPLPDEIDVVAYFEAVRAAIQDHPQWSVDAGAAAIGFFSYSTFLMYNDLDDSNWPSGQNPSGQRHVVALLGSHGFAEPASRFSDETHIDQQVDPKEGFNILDADSSQILALLDVNDGRSLVISGPPGCGKSQTISNMLAEALAAGRTVLFVAEKLAALEVVKRRLDNVGLGVACLELHSHKANKKAVLDDLRETLALGVPQHQHELHKTDQLRRERDLLNAYCEAVNTPIENSGASPYAVYGRLVRIRPKLRHITTPDLAMDGALTWTQSQFDEALNRVTDLELYVRKIGLPQDHVFWGSRLTLALETDKRKLAELSQEGANSAETITTLAAQLAQELGMPAPADLAAVNRLTAAGALVPTAPPLAGVAVTDPRWMAESDAIAAALATWRTVTQLHAEYDDLLLPEAWDQDMLDVRKALVAYGDKWWRIFSGAFRRARNELRGLCRGELPKENAAQLAVVDAVMTVKRAQAQLPEQAALLSALFGPRWQREQSDWDALQHTFDWLRDLHLAVAQGAQPAELLAYCAGKLEPERVAGLTDRLRAATARLGELTDAVRTLLDFDDEARFGPGRRLHDVPLLEQQSLFLQWQRDIETLQDIVSYNRFCARLRDVGLADVVRISADWPEADSHLADLFQRTWYEMLIEHALRTRPEIADFNRIVHEEHLGSFRSLDRLQLSINRVELAEKHWQRMPRHVAGGQLGILRHEFNKKRRHRPIRRLMEDAGHAIQAIKPIFMMSPMSIAMYLPPGAVEFDLVIFDEASQVRPIEAFGAIARGRQVVVVGDDKQLPPTSFFQQMREADEDEESTTDLESILGAFLAKGAPERMLRWHYRSQHESLITVSNKEFYGDRLVVFPSPDKDRRETGVFLHHLPDTVYDRGGNSTNRLEAQSVAAAAIEHARTRPHLSLGIAAFSTKQMEAILDALELLRRANPHLEPFFDENAPEPFFVKNLENVQGDERDVIFISIGYGRDRNGQLSMNFGPLNKSGGERRLNVLITRARRRCVVFTNLTADDISLNRTDARGVHALRQYLHFAAAGSADADGGSARRAAAAPFEEAVADALRAHGFDVHHRIGAAGFFVDLAVVDPDQSSRYLLGIECDGVTYQTARSARDRDRLRQEVLGRLGWSVHRVWSTEWFQSPQRELERLLAAIDRAANGGGAAQPQGGAHASGTLQQVESVTSAAQVALHVPIHRVEHDDSIMAQPSTPLYVEAELLVSDGYELHELPERRMADYIRQVAEIEGPVHRDVVIQRLLAGAGLRRAGSRIQTAVDLALTHGRARKVFNFDGRFVWIGSQKEVPPVRDRSLLPASLRKLDYVCDEEIALAVQQAVRAALGLNREDIPSQAVALFGFKRATQDMVRRVDRLVERMLKDGRLSWRGSTIVANGE